MTKRILDKAIELKKGLNDSMRVQVVTLLMQSDMSDENKWDTLKLFMYDVMTMEDVLDDIIISSN